MNRFTPNFLAIPVLASFLMSPLAAKDTIQETRFIGSLSRSSGDEQIVMRDFEVLLLQGGGLFFSVLDSEKDGCPWPESFGNLNTNNAPKPHLVYAYDDSTYTLPLPALSLAIPKEAAVDTEWVQDGWTFEVAEKVTTGGREFWKIRGQERRGRRLQLTTDPAGLLQSAEMDVFMGQGDKFLLNIEQSSTTTIDAETAKRIETTMESMIGLQAALGRRADSQLTELSTRQIDLAANAIDSLSQTARDTPLQETILRIRRDVTQQQRRISQTMERQQKLINSEAPKFSLNLITSGSLESSSMAGKTVVLHFWNYSDKPLSAPYGQVGYLDPMFSKRKSDNVSVIGIATNPGLQQADQVRAAKRSARKLAEFMNLSYPIGYDNGALIREFGDPRESGGDLPLWVVISADGKVVHYHAGFYEVDQRAGLRDLGEVLDKLK